MVVLLVVLIALSVAAMAITLYRVQLDRAADKPAVLQTEENVTNTAAAETSSAETAAEQNSIGSEADAVPAIKITKPKAGAVFTSPDAPIDFAWIWSGVSQISAPVMQLIDEKGNEVYGKLGGSGMTYSDQGGQGRIPAPANLVIPSGRAKYKVRICASIQKTDCGEGDYFTIVKTAAPKTNFEISFDIYAPKAGEALEAGRSYTIKWKNSGLPAGSVQTIMIMNGTKGTIDEPNLTIVSGLPANVNSHTWTVAANNGWGVGLEDDLWRKVARFFGIKTAYADSNQYVIRISANSPGILGEVGSGISRPFTISQPELKNTCTDDGGIWDDSSVTCACPKHYYWYAGHGCLLDQGEEQK